MKKPQNKRGRGEKEDVDGYVLKGGLLFKFIKPGQEIRELYVIPKAMRKSMVIRYHDLSQHFGIDKTLKRMQEQFYFPRMRQYI